MNFLQRAYLYCFRLKTRTLILFLVFTVVFTLLLNSLTIRDMSENASAGMRTAVGGKLLLEIDTEGNYGDFKENDFGSSSVYIGDYVTKPIIDAISNVEGVVDYNVEDAEAAYYAGVSFQYIPTKWNFSMTQYGDYGTFTACLSSERCSAFESGKYTLIDGRHIKPDDSYCILISKELADYNGISVGDTVKMYDTYLDSIGKTPFVEMEIAGIFDGTEGTATGGEVTASDLQSNCGFIAYNTIFRVYEDVYQNGEEYYSVTIYIKDPAEIQTIYNEIEKLPEIQGKTLKLSMVNEKYQTVETPLNTLKSSVNTTIIIIIFTSFIVITFLLTFWIRGRKKEIGILLSIGKSKANIVFQVLSESSAAFIIAFFVSVLLSNFTVVKVGSFLFPEIVDGKNNVPVQVSANYLFLVCGIGFFLAALSVVISCWSVYRLKPKDILVKIS